MTLQQLCTARGLTLEDLARRAGVLSTTVRKIDEDTIRAHPATLRRLAVALELEPATLARQLSAGRDGQGGSAQLSVTDWR